MKTSMLLIHNLNVGQLPKAEADMHVAKCTEKLAKKLNLPKHVKLVVNRYSDRTIGYLPPFETISL